MDSSGSVGYSGWETEVEFVSNMITSGVDDNSYIGVMYFDSGACSVWKFNDTQSPRSLITDAIDDIYFDGGATWMKTAVNMAITEFETYGDAKIPNLMMFITDGNPWPSWRQDPCELADDLQAAGMYNV